MGIDINPDYAIIVTEDWYTERHGPQDYSRVVVKVGDLSAIEDVKAAIDQQINRRSEVVDILDSREILELYYETIDAINIFLLGIGGGVSLLVASVSILNVMIISVTERTAEIGLMRSIGGARKREVLRMFLYESLFLGGVIGSIIGGIASTAVAFSASASISDLFADFSVSGEAGIPISVVIGYVAFAMPSASGQVSSPDSTPRGRRRS
ncbi:FtsX-like permease family protein [Methanoculleus chikugoensis]|uniref:ABC transporter permease n=1 Tax=Methanoculleus chikugoensis TaxID=118126 RepID=UPI000AD865E0|nr:FtsX-like permease family protein [Methanoculleus chikugoensis]